MQRLSKLAAACAVLVVTSCASGSAEPVSSVSVDQVNSSTPPSVTATSPATSVALTAPAASTSTSIAPPTMLATFDVDDAPLPDGVVSLYSAAHGRTFTGTAVFEHYGIPDMPRPDSPSAIVGSVETIVTPFANGVVSRFDAVSWLFSDPRPPVELAETAANAAGLVSDSDGIKRLEFILVNGGRCAQVDFADPEVSWNVIACDPGDATRSVQIVRSMSEYSATRPPELVSIGADTDPFAQAVSGIVAGWEFELLAPGNPPIYRYSVTYRTTLDTATLVSIARENLVGWVETAEDNYGNISFNQGSVAWKFPLEAAQVGTITFTSPDFDEWT